MLQIILTNSWPPHSGHMKIMVDHAEQKTLIAMPELFAEKSENISWPLLLCYEDDYHYAPVPPGNET